jgi:hypothetical protein
MRVAVCASFSTDKQSDTSILRAGSSVTAAWAAAHPDAASASCSVSVTATGLAEISDLPVLYRETCNLRLRLGLAAPLGVDVNSHR